MMKQPAENTNATLAEIEAAAARALPISVDSAEIQEQVAKLAYELWQKRQGERGTAEEDWFRAEAIVWNLSFAKNASADMSYRQIIPTASLCWTCDDGHSA